LHVFVQFGGFCIFFNMFMQVLYMLGVFK
jgi:hypothetical protein